MEIEKDVRDANEDVDVLFNLPSLDSPLLEIDSDEPISCRSTENKVKNRRDKYKISKLNSMPVESKFVGRGKTKIFKIESEYTFIQTLGVGTYGEVKLASCVSDPSKLVAIKVSKGHTSVNMLKNEAEILKKINHECFPKFIDLKIDDFANKAYLIIEYFEGNTLDSYLEDHEIDETDTLNHLKMLADAIKYLHSNKIAHRDLKPQNIIVTIDNKLKVIDFNISKRFVDRSFKEDKKNSKFEQKFFTQICSPMFAAPEILSADCYSESVDIWGLGVIYLSMLCGIEIFKNKEIKKLSECNIDKLIRDSSTQVSDRASLLAIKMLAKASEERPTIEELCSFIEE